MITYTDGWNSNVVSHQNDSETLPIRPANLIKYQPEIEMTGKQAERLVKIEECEGDNQHTRSATFHYKFTTFQIFIFRY